MTTEKDLRPYHIYFACQMPTLFNTEEFRATEPTFPRKMLICTSWGELAEYFKFKPISICVNAQYFLDQSLVQIINMIETLSDLVGNEDGITITLGVTPTTPYSLIKEAQKTKILGIIPSSDYYPSEETVRGINAQWAGFPYWPKHIIDRLPGAVKPRRPTEDIKLTNRQQQIFNMVVSGGYSNRHIAKIIGIAESTVKLHMGHIFKKYCVRNRTQLAIFAKSTNN